MPSLATDTLIPLSLSEQLDALLSGWLDRNAPGYDADADGLAGGTSRSRSARSPRSSCSARAGA